MGKAWPNERDSQLIMLLEWAPCPATALNRAIIVAAITVIPVATDADGPPDAATGKAGTTAGMPPRAGTSDIYSVRDDAAAVEAAVAVGCH